MSDPVTFEGTPWEYRDRQEIRGIELSSGFQTADWDINAAVTYADNENRDTGKRLPRRAEKNVRLDVGRLFDTWSEWGPVSSPKADRYNDAGLAHQSAARLWHHGCPGRPGNSFRDGLRELKVANVFDRQYSTSLGYDSSTFEPFEYLAAGRTYVASVRYDFRQ